MFNAIIEILLIWTFVGGVIWAILLDFPSVCNMLGPFFYIIGGPAILITCGMIWLCDRYVR